MKVGSLDEVSIMLTLLRKRQYILIRLEVGPTFIAIDKRIVINFTEY